MEKRRFSTPTVLLAFNTSRGKKKEKDLHFWRGRNVGSPRTTIFVVQGLVSADLVVSLAGCLPPPALQARIDAATEMPWQNDSAEVVLEVARNEIANSRRAAEGIRSKLLAKKQPHWRSWVI